ncbi:hypothetical protein C8J56DRAFT_513417 [Mycena floridula]|nr:hypothetical protein C8J56DRAFT_513417 [Mycena floridula]
MASTAPMRPPTLLHIAIAAFVAIAIFSAIAACLVITSFLVIVTIVLASTLGPLIAGGFLVRRLWLRRYKPRRRSRRSPDFDQHVVSSFEADYHRLDLPQPPKIALLDLSRILRVWNFENRRIPLHDTTQAVTTVCVSWQGQDFGSAKFGGTIPNSQVQSDSAFWLQPEDREERRSLGVAFASEMSSSLSLPDLRPPSHEWGQCAEYACWPRLRDDMDQARRDGKLFALKTVSIRVEDDLPMPMCQKCRWLAQQMTRPGSCLTITDLA